MVRRFLLVALAFVALAARTLPASAQDDYPPEILDPSACLRLLGDVRVSGNRLLVLFRGRLGAEGAQGCALANERVRLVVRSHPILLGQTIASEDGSYRVEAGGLPPHIVVGDHIVRGEFGDGRAVVQRPITVVSSFAQAVATRRPATTATLPRTGAGIAILMLAALVLIGFGTTLVVFAYRWLRRRTTARRRDPNIPLPAPALPPRVDTTSFSEQRRADQQESAAEEHATEADLLGVAAETSTDRQA